MNNKSIVINKDLSNWIKFISALVVAFHHYSQYICANGLSDNIIYKLLSTQGGYVAVAVFFFLSGYGLMESEKKKHLDFISFIKKRFLRVYLPVLLVTILWLPIHNYIHEGNLIGGGGFISIVMGI